VGREGAGDQDGPVGSVLAGLDRRSHGPPVDLGHVVAEAGRLEREAVAGKRVGGDHLGAGADVVLVDAMDDVGVVEHRKPAPRRSVHRHTASLELGPGACVDHDDLAVGEATGQCFGHGASLLARTYRTLLAGVRESRRDVMTAESCGNEAVKRGGAAQSRGRDAMVPSLPGMMRDG
jgi:hypothetical protein